MCQYTLKDNNRTVNNYTEVDCPETHKIGRDPKHSHKNKAKQHSQWYHRSDNNPRPHISEKDDKYEKYNYRPLDKIVDDGRDISVYKFRAIEIRLDSYALGQHLLHLGYPLLKSLCHHIGISALKHHGYTAHTLSVAIHRHGTESLGRAKIHLTDVTDMHRHPSTIGHHNLLDVLLLADHSLGTYIIGPAHLLDVTASSILVVP